MIHVVLGTKAQLVKMAPVLAELQRRQIPFRFIFTGQHHETMEDLRENFAIKDPDIILHKGKDITSVPKMFFWMIKILFQTIFARKRIFGVSSNRQDIVLVHGDTFSTLLGALMGRLAGKRVAHIESGLRSFNAFHPFPEEITRILVFLLSDIFYCPGSWAVANLSKFKGRKIDTQYNTLLDSLAVATQEQSKANVLIPTEKYCVVTTHRFENIFSKKIFERNINLILSIADSMKVIFIMHPVTRHKLEQFNLLSKLANVKNIELRPRYDYFNFMKLVYNSEFAVTDGGSNQEECYYMGKPCLLLRKATERVEGLNSTTVISNYSEEVFKSFLKNYMSHKGTILIGKVSPTSLIVDDLMQIKKVSSSDSKKLPL